MITLINGPYNGRQIEDSGADPIRMGIYDHTKPPGVHIGVANLPAIPAARSFGRAGVLGWQRLAG